MTTRNILLASVSPVGAYRIAFGRSVFIQDRSTLPDWLLIFAVEMDSLEVPEFPRLGLYDVRLRRRYILNSTPFARRGEKNLK